MSESTRSTGFFLRAGLSFRSRMPPRRGPTYCRRVAESFSLRDPTRPDVPGTGETGPPLLAWRQIFLQPHPRAWPAVQIPAVVFEVVIWRGGASFYLGSSRRHQLPPHAAAHHDSKTLSSLSGICLPAGRFSSDHKSIEISIRPLKRSAAVCSRCHQPAPGYDQLAEHSRDLPSPRRRKSIKIVLD